MSGWRGGIEKFRVRSMQRINAVHANASDKVKMSVVEGSQLTGAPGQPVDTGFLKSSWIGAFPAQTLYHLDTDVEYAPIVEEGGLVEASGRSGAMSGGTYTLRSKTGGFHSVKMTRSGFQRILNAAMKEEIRD